MTPRRSPRVARDGVHAIFQPLEGVYSQKLPKYGNVATVVDGRRFASKKEAARYQALRVLETAGAITALECQPSYRLEAHGWLICRYLADFRYVVAGTGQMVVEDVKGVRTPAFVLKKRLMLACHGIDVVEV